MDEMRIVDWVYLVMSHQRWPVGVNMFFAYCGVARWSFTGIYGAGEIRLRLSMVDDWTCPRTSMFS